MEWAHEENSGAVCKSIWTSGAPVPNKPMVSVDGKATLNNRKKIRQINRCGISEKDVTES